MGAPMIQAACSCALLLSLFFVPMVALNRRDRRAERQTGHYR